MAELRLNNLVKRYGDVTAVRGIDLDVAEGEFVVLVGPSGCGKSTTLRMVAGLEEITDGALTIGNRRVNDLAPGERDIAMVFQNYALYPHMTVAQNIAFGLRRSGLSRAERKAKVAEVARSLEIEPLLSRRPKALSGGQRQRVAMGRAIVRDPQVFLFDEPLSNLDAKLRVQMRIEIKRLHQRLPVTTLYVTHDQTEAMTMADRVVVMNGGRIEQVGPPMEIYRKPRSKFVAEFIGAPAMNIFAARLSPDGDAIDLPEGTRLVVPEHRRATYARLGGREVSLGIRPEDIRLDGDGPRVPISVVEPLGVETLVYFTLAGRDGCARVAPDLAPRPGTAVSLAVDMDKAVIFDPDTDAAVVPPA